MSGRNRRANLVDLCRDLPGPFRMLARLPAQIENAEAILAAGHAEGGKRVVRIKRVQPLNDAFSLELLEVLGRTAVVMQSEEQFSFVAGNRYNRLCQ